MSDAQLIAATLADFEKNDPAAKPSPVVKQPMRPKPAKPARVAVPDTEVGARVGDEDDWDEGPANAGRRVPEGPKPTVADAPKPLVPATGSEIVLGDHGFPLIGELESVKQADANAARLREQLAEAQKRVEESAASMGMSAGELRPDRVERLAAQWLVDGRPLDVIEKFETQVKHVKRLEAALAIASKQAVAARELGMKRLMPAAQEQLKPTFAAMQKARAALAHAIVRHLHRCRLLTAAGFPGGYELDRVNPTVPLDPLNIATDFRGQVERGFLTPEDIAGLPGID
jgi:hypothetical protein